MNANDPRLTAHALGEADAESAEHIARDPALAAESAQVERFAAQLRAELHAEPAPALRAEQRDAVLADAGIAFGPAHWWQRGPMLSAAAACLALVLGAAIYFQARHLGSLRPLASDAAAPPAAVNVRWTDDTRPLPPEAITAPKAPAPSTRPTYQSLAPIVARSSTSPAITAAVEPSPRKVEAASEPAGRTLPADAERVSAAPLRKR